MFQVTIKAAEDEGLVDLQVSVSENDITTIMIIVKSSIRLRLCGPLRTEGSESARYTEQ